jgi:hypothetical protein
MNETTKVTLTFAVILFVLAFAVGVILVMQGEPLVPESNVVDSRGQYSNTLKTFGSTEEMQEFLSRKGVDDSYLGYAQRAEEILRLIRKWLHLRRLLL